MKRIPVTDAGFLLAETPQQPMHVGGLALFTPPEGASEDELLHEFIDIARATDEFRYPFDQRPVNRMGQFFWEADESLDIDYHVRHAALPAPGRYREMFALVSRMHATRLSRSRPLWETTIIEGLESGQFAMYSKMHHTMIDGLGAMKLMNDAMSEDPNERGMPFPFAKREMPKRPKRAKPERPSNGALNDYADLLKKQYDSGKNVLGALSRMVDATIKPDSTPLAGLHNAPRTVLNHRIHAPRRVVAQSYNLDRVHRIAKAYDATINDIVMAMCSHALRQHLFNHYVLPEKPLIAAAPVGLKLRSGGAGDGMGNAVGMILVNLATNIGDPVERLKAIQASAREAKGVMESMSINEVLALAGLSSAPTILPSLTGLSDLIAPNYNVMISNVPGPRNRLYWNGAKLDNSYPVSIPMHGVGVNITITSYVDNLNFGITACRKSVPKAQRLIDFLEQGLADLEVGAGLASGQAA